MYNWIAHCVTTMKQQILVLVLHNNAIKTTFICCPIYKFQECSSNAAIVSLKENKLMWPPKLLEASQNLGCAQLFLKYFASVHKRITNLKIMKKYSSKLLTVHSYLWGGSWRPCDRNTTLRTRQVFISRGGSMSAEYCSHMTESIWITSRQIFNFCESWSHIWWITGIW